MFLNELVKLTTDNPLKYKLHRYIRQNAEMES